MGNARSKQPPEAKKAEKAKDKRRKANLQNHDGNYEGHKGELNSAKYGQVQGRIEPINLGDMTAQCHECGAFMFPWESHKKTKDGNLTFSLCCSHGKIKLPDDPSFPSLLQELLLKETPEGRAFYNNVRSYNSALSCASKGFSGKPFTYPNSRGPQMFKVSGQMFHCMGNVEPNPGEAPEFSQIYVYDEQHELDYRMNSVPGMTQALLEKLLQMLHENNEWIRQYINAAQKMREHSATNVQMVLKARTNTNSNKVYDKPSHKDIAIIIPNRADNDLKNPRDVILYKNQENNPKGNKTVRISSLHKAYDPTAYPLLFPHGNYGFDLEGNIMENGKKCNTLKYYQYKLMERCVNPRQPTLHNTGRLFQEYLCDMYSKIEEERLAYHELNQQQLRADTLDGIVDAISSGDTENGIGKEIKLPASFVLSQRWMYAHYLDALAIARHYKKFSWFITITCNPQLAQDLERIYEAGQSPADRPDLLDRMYNQQMKVFMKDLTKNHIMGTAMAWVLVFERQLRNLWHGHVNLLTEGIVPESEIDFWIRAQLPDYDPENPDRNPEEREYYELVGQHMLHGPCGPAYPDSPCMVPNKDGKKACRAGYPKLFSEKTHLQTNGYPNYARPDNKITFKKNGFVFDNRWVVPHNKFILCKYKCHVNVEYTASLSTVRYSFKYQHKGTDLATIQLLAKEDGKPKNEISLYVNSRFIDPHLAIWRIFEYKIQERYPAVLRLDIHEDGKQFVSFKPGEEADKIANPKVTKLIAWFKYNKSQLDKKLNREPYDENFDKYTYMQFPEHYTYNETKKEWKPRVHDSQFPSCIGRIHAVPRSNDDVYYLRMLLHHVKGAASFSDVRTIDDVVYDTYKAAAGILGLLTDDKEIEYAMQETWDFGNSQKLRSLFAILLNYSEISNPNMIFEKFIDDMMADIEYENPNIINRNDLINKCLIKLDDLLQDMGSSMAEFPDLPQPDLSQNIISEARAFRRERYDDNEQLDKFNTLMPNLAKNADQLNIFEQIKNAIDNNLAQQFVINAPGGCGKTFVFDCVSTYVRSQGNIVICCASTGIAAWNLEGGRTAHSTFKIPIDADKDSTSSIKAQSSEAAVIKESKMVIWDEIFNVHQHNIVVVERLLRDVMGNKLPWGGKIVLFGGDPRQTPPVVKKGKRGETVAASFKSCPLYNNIIELTLTKNMRVKNADIPFCDWLLQIGNGTINDSTKKDEMWVKIPPNHLVNSKMDLIEETFPNLNSMSKEDLMSSGIFCPKNDDAWEINRICLNKLPGETRTYLSCDRVEEEDCVDAQTELLNNRKPSGFPDHNLILKVGAPVMLLRNLQCGLVNGTRMLITAMHDKVLECEIMVGKRKGEIIFIPRIPMYDRSNEYPWTMIRVQYPIRVAFSMSIHKSQGSSMTRVGIYVAQNMFAHGQLYVAVSRSIQASGLKVYIEGGKDMLQNIVYKEIL